MTMRMLALPSDLFPNLQTSKIQLQENIARVQMA